MSFSIKDIGYFEFDNITFSQLSEIVNVKCLFFNILRFRKGFLYFFINIFQKDIIE